MKDRLQQLQSAFEGYGLGISDEQSFSFLRYAELLEEWSSRFNLTAVLDFSEMLHRHFVDSVFPFAAGLVPSEGSLLDLGSGAGFPGIPLKIMFPSLDITLMDSLDKRIGFLNHVIKELSLKDIRAEPRIWPGRICGSLFLS